MKVYTLQNASSVGNEDYGVFKVDKDGAVEVPEEFGADLRDHYGADGAKAWEDEVERHARLTAEELKRRSDPAALYDLIAAGQGQPAPRAARKTAARKTAAKKAAPRKTAARKTAAKTSAKPAR